MNRIAPSMALAALCLLGGCSQGVLVVELTANPPIEGVDHLEVQVTAAGRTGDGRTEAQAPFTLDNTPRTFGIAIPDAQRMGQVLVRVSAMSGTTRLGSGEEVVADIAAALDRGAPLRVHLGTPMVDGGGGGGHRDGWSEECRSALFCTDFEDGGTGSAHLTQMNASVDVVTPTNGSRFAMRSSPGVRPLDTVSGTLDVPVDTTMATTGLYLRFRMRVTFGAAASYFNALELNTAGPTNVYLGFYDNTRRLTGRRVPDGGPWGFQPVVNEEWHCVLWNVLGGPATRSHLWFDGVEQLAFDVGPLAPLDFTRVRFGLGADGVAPAARGVSFDDLLVTLHPPSHDCL